MKRTAVAVLVALLVCVQLSCWRQESVFAPASLFADGMVLQRDTRAPIWGRARPGQVVRASASWLEDEFATVTDVAGVWVLRLPTPAAGGPHTLTLRGEREIVLRDVWSGDVWLCAGGADMEWRVAPGEHGGVIADERELAPQDNPRIAHFEVRNTLAARAQADVEGQWMRATPENVGQFSATAWFFALELERETGVPIGIVNATAGGARAQSWIGEFHVRGNLVDPAELTLVDALRQRGVERVDEGLLEAEPALTPSSPTLLYNGMVVPLAPYAIRGVVWRQGESDLDRCHAHTRYLRTLIECWRDLWCEPKLPFLLVQLPPLTTFDVSASGILRNAQRLAAREPRVGLVVASDLGRDDGRAPRNEREIGRRLALQALVVAYGRSDVLASGPLLREARSEGNVVRLEFEHAQDLGALDGALRGFEMCGPDGAYFVAQARVEGSQVVVSCPQVPIPQVVRYAFADPSAGNLSNASKLPAASFVVDLTSNR